MDADKPKNGPLGLVLDNVARLAVTQTTEKDGYFVESSPEKANFYFGNRLYLDGHAPRDSGDVALWLQTWIARYRAEFADIPVERVNIFWDEPAPREGAEFWLSRSPPRGFELSCESILACRNITAAPLPEGAADSYNIDRILSDNEWQQLLDLMVVVNADEDDDSEAGGMTVAFCQWLWSAYRELVSTGRASWWGVWQNGELCASLGVVESADVVRYQEVQTHPAHRRRGLCAALCSRVGNDALARNPDATAYLIAAQGSEAERVYRRIGFLPIGVRYVVLGPISDDNGAI